MNSYYKTYVFFVGILVFSIIFIVKPPEGGSLKERNSEEVATLEVRDFTLLSIVDKKPEMKVTGQKGMQFADREEFWDFSLTNYNAEVGGLKALKSQNHEEHFYVVYGIKKKNIYLFKQGVRYLNADGIQFQAIGGSYDPQKKLFQTEGSFELKTPEGIFKGKNLYYDGFKEELKADLPRGKVWLEG